MNMDTELEGWRREWQTEAGVSPGLRRRVERHTRFMRLMLLSELLVTAVIGGGVAVLAVRSPRPDMLVLALGTWTFIAAAWIFALVTRRGLWSPSALTTAAFIDLSIRRCRAALAASIFGTVLYFCEIAFCLAWIYRRAGLDAGFVAFIGGVSVVFIALVFWYRRRKRAELAYLLGLQN